MLVKVHNDNVHPHSEEFRGTKLVIPAKGYIEMEYEDAIQFKGQCTGIAPVGEDGNPDARFFKMLRVDHVPPEEIFHGDDGLTNHLTGKKASSAEELIGQLIKIARDRPDLVVKDPEAEKAQADEVASLRAELAELRAMVTGEPKRPVGRPRKEAAG